MNLLIHRHRPQHWDDLTRSFHLESRPRGKWPILDCYLDKVTTERDFHPSLTSKYLVGKVLGEETTSSVRHGYRRDNFDWLIYNYEYLLIPRSFYKTKCLLVGRSVCPWKKLENQKKIKKSNSLNIFDFLIKFGPSFRDVSRGYSGGWRGLAGGNWQSVLLLD